MSKHAYLIIAHNNFYVLEKLLKMIDDERNDIYIHIDKKSKDFDFNYFNNICNKSHVRFVKRIKVYWGGYSQVQCELNLLKEAIKNKYEYYHLLSGSDLPIKDQDYIHKFFDKHKGKEFIRFMNSGWDYNRVSKVHLFNDYCKINNNLLSLIYIYINKLCDKIINKNGFDYTQKFKFKLKKGDQWFSITHECAKYICDNYKLIKKLFKYSVCPDEHFVHTITYNSKFKDNISYDTCLREIDWNRGFPHIYNVEDYDMLNKSTNLFARKFDSNVDKTVIDKIYKDVIGREIYGLNKCNYTSI